jgi:hypothetical protein
MLVRRIAASACALSLVIPAAALAVQAQDPPAAKQQPAVVTYGDTKYDLQNQQDLSTAAGDTAAGDTKNDLRPATPAVQVPPAAPKSFASHDTTNGWQIAAWAEAAVLAALALGSAVLISGRTRSRRLSS